MRRGQERESGKKKVEKGRRKKVRGGERNIATSFPAKKKTWGMWGKGKKKGTGSDAAALSGKIEKGGGRGGRRQQVLSPRGKRGRWWERRGEEKKAATSSHIRLMGEKEKREEKKWPIHFRKG